MRADPHPQVGGIRAEGRRQPIDHGGHDPLHGAPSAGVGHAEGPAHRVPQHDGLAVGDEDRERRPGNVGDQPVDAPRRSRASSSDGVPGADEVGGDRGDVGAVGVVPDGQARRR